MKKLLCTFLIFSATVFGIIFSVNAQTKSAKPVIYDAELSQYSYPFPVKYMALKLENIPCKMAYMDVAASGKKENKPVVLLLHGKNFFGAYWQQTVRFLTAKGYRVLVPDQIGFGKSTKAPLHYSFHQLAWNTKKLLDTLGIKQVIVVGHSMGGMLATRFALMYPETTVKLVLENPIGLEDYRQGVPFQTVDEAYQKELKNSGTAIQNYFKTYFPAWKPEYEEWVRVPSAQISSPDFPQVAFASALTYDMIFQQPVCYEFDKIKVPALVVIGQEDRTVVGKALIKDKQQLAQMGQYPALGKRTAQAIPGAKLIELPGVGHIPHLQVPDKFNEVLLTFLAAKK